MKRWPLLLAIGLLHCESLLSLRNDYHPIEAGVDSGPEFGPLSCRGLPRTCGDKKNESCCAPAAIGGGTIRRSILVEADGGLGTQNVSGFRFDRFKVTVGRFRKFIAATIAGYTPAIGSGKHTHLLGKQIDGEVGWRAEYVPLIVHTKIEWDEQLAICEINGERLWTPEPGPNETRPMNCITWAEAYAFCIWDGGFLPTHGESDAIAGRTRDGVIFPWETTDLDWRRASYSNMTSCVGDPAHNGIDHPCTVGDIVEVGSKPLGEAASRAMESAGTLYELVLDFARSKTPMPDGCQDCALFDDDFTTERLSHGSSFKSDPMAVQEGAGRKIGFMERSEEIGFRCAYP